MPNNPGAQNPFPGPVNVDGYQRIAGSCPDTQQVRLYNGNLQAAVTVVDVPTVGFPLRFTLFYNALAAQSLTEVGYGWTHNYNMHLTFTGTPMTQIVFTSDSGRQFGFIQPGGTGPWQPDTASGYYFFPGTLVDNATYWTITFPDGSYYTFARTGQLTGMTDRHGNTTQKWYVGANLVITDPTGRTITAALGGVGLASITDPRGKTTALTYDVNSNLTGIALPTGCTTTYAYQDATNTHLLTSRTDARGKTYSFTYLHDGTLRLSTVTDAESPAHQISYSYGSLTERVADSNPTTQNFPYTALADARGNTWTYVFDLVGNLRRILDPKSHSRFFYWDQIVSGQGASEQKLLLGSGGFPYNSNQAQVDTNNVFRRFAYDSTNNNGNLLYACDATGMITQYTYDTKRNVTSVYPGQAHLGVQGNWVGQYGADGYVLCAANHDASDIVSLPSYVSILPTLTNGYRYKAGEVIATFNRRMDPRAVTIPGSLGQSLGFWQNATGTSFTVQIRVYTAKSFNLSLYTHSADAPHNIDSPLVYDEEFGRDITLTVADKNGTQSFRVYNNAPGVWATFPVTADTTHPVTITVATSGANTGTAVISAIAFDPLDSHRTTYNRNATGDITSIVDALGNTTSFAYNTNGTLQSVTSPPPQQGGQSQVTQFAYTDAYNNLTSITDASGAITGLTYDLNGNVLTVTDPNGNTATYAYDDNNRLTSITDALGNVTAYQYDVAGNLTRVTDANNNATQFQYTNTNRLSAIIDALNQQTSLTYDGSGNLLTITDPKSHTTTLTYDTADRLVAVLLPDAANKVTYAFDALDRLRAVSSPNANQSNLANVVVANALNWILNYDAEDVDPFNAAQPQSWSSIAPGASRDTNAAHAHSGTSSLLLPSTTSPRYFSQSNLPILPGTTSLVRLWAMTDAQPNVASVWASLFPVDQTGASSEKATDPTTLAATSSYALTSVTANSLITVPGDAQATRYAAAEFRAYAQTTTGTANVWLDDVQALLLSSGFTYDAEGRLSRTVTPDGAGTQAVRDRFGRIIKIVDPRGREVAVTYDSLNRVTRVVDPLQNAVQYAYDALGNLLTFTDPRNNATGYSYDSVNRLTRITYPDNTTEQFSYDLGGRLASYTNNRGQVRTFTYDSADRLIRMTYLTDNTTVQFSYDKVGNVTQRVERNYDRVVFDYDVLYRLKGETRMPFAASDSAWLQAHTYDAVGNRTQFKSGAAGPLYDQAHYDVDSYASPTVLWSVPDPPGYDAMDRLTAYLDRRGNQTRFSYDVESRRTGIVYPNGTPAVSTAAGYDVVGKLTSLNTSRSSSILAVTYAYDLASNRIGLVANNDSIDYDVDDAGRLVEEDLNRFVERSSNRFRSGSLAGCAFDGSGNVTLLAYADVLWSPALDLSRWRPAVMTGDYVGLEIRPGYKLQLAFPRGYSNLQGAVPANAIPFGLTTNSGNGVWGAVQLRSPLAGNFDVDVSFSNLMAPSDQNTTAPWGVVQAALVASPNPIESLVAANTTYALISKVNSSLPDETGVPLYPHYLARFVVPGYPIDTVHAPQSGDLEGSLRVVRTNGTDLNVYFWDNSLQPPAWRSMGPWPGFSSAGLYLSLLLRTWPNSNAPNGTIGSTSFRNFVMNSPTPAYPSSGTYTSGVYDAGQTVTWNSISWVATTPAGTSVQLQVFGGTSPYGPWTSGGTYTTSPGTLPANFNYRYVYYQATLTGTGSATPTLSEVDVAYTGTNASALTTYVYDAAGNITQKTTVSAAGTTTEVRDNAAWPSADRINSLNQVLRNDVTPPGGPTTTWRYTFDASGNMTSKTDGTSTWTYTWDEDNRLLQVQKTGVSPFTVSYTYDSLGRMLTRTDAVGTTAFEWDGMTMVRETQTWVGGATIVYYAPLGELLSFDRTVGGVTSTFQVHSDALGSVRAITDNTGAVVSHFEYDAWGNTLPSSSDGVPGGWNYLFVGSLGVRFDAATGLHYMRQRWYSAPTTRFLTRDIMRAASNRYVYAANSPTRFMDSNGLAPEVSNPQDIYIYTNTGEDPPATGILGGAGLFQELAYNLLGQPLALSFRSPQGLGSSSWLFISKTPQVGASYTGLRLDYGNYALRNMRGDPVPMPRGFHWNQRGVQQYFPEFSRHTAANPCEVKFGNVIRGQEVQILGRRAFLGARSAGRGLVYVGIAVDTYRFSNEVARSTGSGEWGNTGRAGLSIAGGWAGAAAGAELLGTLGATVGSFAGPIGTGIGGGLGGFLGGGLGYFYGSNTVVNIIGR